MSETKTPAQVLTEAADHIETVGLYKGSFFERGGSKPLAARSCCALGAIAVSSGYFIEDPHNPSGWMSIYATVTFEGGQEADATAALDTAAVDALAAVVDEKSGGNFTVPRWSDSADTTAADVAAAMRAAANRLGS